MSRLSQAIAEGDGISVLVEVSDGQEAGRAEQHGADALVRQDGCRRRAERNPTPRAPRRAGRERRDRAAGRDRGPPDVDVWEEAQALGVECVVQVSDPDELELALEEIDPEVFLLSPDPSSDDDALETLLTLLHDVPAGKLAIAELHDASADDVAELERAGVDAVLVTSRDVAALVPAEPPDV